jgi:hypothetical protein
VQFQYYRMSELIFLNCKVDTVVVSKIVNVVWLVVAELYRGCCFAIIVG